MRRKITIFLGLVGVLVVVLTFSGRLSLPKQQESPKSTNVNDTASLIEYLPLHPLSPSPSHPLSQMQDLVDQISQDAARNQWQSASQSVERLEEAWERGVLKQERKLEVEKQISDSIRSLRRHVWALNKKETLQEAQNLTELISRLLTD